MPAPAFLGALAVTGIFSKIFVAMFAFFVGKVGRRIAWVLISISVILAMFAAFWTGINASIAIAQAQIGPEYFVFIPMFFPPNTDDVIALALSIRVGASIVVFNAQFVKLFTQF